jgi:pSer/pThr/pTyr-binding forkhead associated (FHA) protein
MVKSGPGRRKLAPGFPCEDERMKAEHHRVEDGGTVLEPVGHLRAALGEAGAEPAGTRVEPRPSGAPAAPPPAKPSDGERSYRPLIRPLVPRLTLLDDGDLAVGETVRLREAVTVIGRTEGDVRLPHDPLVSGRHAEIAREGGMRPHRWLLRDLGSSNGTFVRCARTVLRPESLVMLGGRRFRFQPAAAAPVGETAASGTLAVDVAAMRSGGWPTLVELGQAAGGLELRLAGHDLTIGRPGHGNAVEIADPLLAERHARVHCDPTGRWVLEALPSVNGVWAQVTAVQLAVVCRFQIGEQRFLFVVD